MCNYNKLKKIINNNILLYFNKLIYEEKIINILSLYFLVLKYKKMELKTEVSQLKKKCIGNEKRFKK
jgi:hypothetical protein